MNVPLVNPLSFIQVLGVTTRKAFILICSPLVKMRVSWRYQPCLISPLPLYMHTCTRIHTPTHSSPKWEFEHFEEMLFFHLSFYLCLLKPSLVAQ